MGSNRQLGQAPVFGGSEQQFQTETDVVAGACVSTVGADPEQVLV